MINKKIKEYLIKEGWEEDHRISCNCCGSELDLIEVSGENPSAGIYNQDVGPEHVRGEYLFCEYCAGTYASSEFRYNSYGSKEVLNSLSLGLRMLERRLLERLKNEN